ncbi:hypothetical protein RUND412_010105 [Rhizina undulata]
MTTMLVQRGEMGDCHPGATPPPGSSTISVSGGFRSPYYPSESPGPRPNTGTKPQPALMHYQNRFYDLFMKPDDSAEGNCIKRICNRLLAAFSFLFAALSWPRWISQYCYKSIMDYMPMFAERFKMLRVEMPAGVSAEKVSAQRNLAEERQSGVGSALALPRIVPVEVALVEVETVFLEISVTACSAESEIDSKMELFTTVIIFQSRKSGFPVITLTDYDVDAPTGFDGDRHSEMHRSMSDRGRNYLWSEWRGKFTVKNKRDRLRNSDGNIFEDPEDETGEIKELQIEVQEVHIVAIGVLSGGSQSESEEEQDYGGEAGKRDGLEWWEMDVEDDQEEEQYDFEGEDEIDDVAYCGIIFAVDSDEEEDAGEDSEDEDSEEDSEDEEDYDSEDEMSDDGEL